MQDPRPPTDTHDESYFASFTDMLVGILFIFIILLMIFANNYQEATVSVEQTKKTLEEERVRLRDETQAREEAERHAREIAEIKAQAEAEKAAAEAQVEEALKALAEAEARAAEMEQAAQQAMAAYYALEQTQSIQEAKNPAMGEAPANDDVKKTRTSVENLFNDSRGKVLRKLQETLNAQGINARADIGRGLLSIPESFLFDPTQGQLNLHGKQTASALAGALGTYLPCISSAGRGGQLSGCGQLGFTPHDGLDAVFIDDYPGINGTQEEKLLMSVRRSISVFNEIKTVAPNLDRQLKNIRGAPILNVRVRQERRKANNRDREDSKVDNSVVLRFVMRKPSDKDIQKLQSRMR